MTTGSAIIERYNQLAPHYNTRSSRYLQTTLSRSMEWLRPDLGLSVLDVGCGTGLFLEWAQQRLEYPTLAGIDASKGMLTKARQRLGESADLRLGQAQMLPYETASFDAIVCLNTLHCLSDPEGALAEMARVIRTDGQCLLTDWCRPVCFYPLMRLWLKIRKLPCVRLYSRREMEALLGKAGFLVRHTEKYSAPPGWPVVTLDARAGKSE